MAQSWPLDLRRAEEWMRGWFDLFSSASAAAGNTAVRLLPVDPFEPVLAVLRDRLLGRRRSVRYKNHDVGFVLDNLHIDAGELLRAVGQYGEVRISAHDVEWDGGRIERVEIRARNLHVRPGASPTLVTAPVLWEAHVTMAQTSSWCSRVAPALRVDADENGPHVGLARRAPWARVEFEPRADGRSLRLVPRALRIGSRRLPLRMPSYNVRLDRLPSGVLITAIEVGKHGLIVRGQRIEWQRSLSRADIETLMRSVRSGSGRVDV